MADEEDIESWWSMVNDQERVKWTMWLRWAEINQLWDTIESFRDDALENKRKAVFLYNQSSMVEASHTRLAPMAARKRVVNDLSRYGKSIATLCIRAPACITGTVTARSGVHSSDTGYWRNGHVGVGVLCDICCGGCGGSLSHAIPCRTHISEHRSPLPKLSILHARCKVEITVWSNDEKERLTNRGVEQSYQMSNVHCMLLILAHA